MIRGEARPGLEIESTYLVGDFAVANQEDLHFRLTRRKTRYQRGNLVDQGYPFYAGNVLLKKEVILKSVRKGEKAGGGL